jgi:hypothetical protein
MAHCGVLAFRVYGDRTEGNEAMDQGAALSRTENDRGSPSSLRAAAERIMLIGWSQESGYS